MNTTLYFQIIALIHFILTGILIGILFDVFRAMRRSIKIPNFVTYMQDVLFWFLSGIIIIYTIINYTDGEVRAYMVIGIVIGGALYFYLVSKFVVKIITELFSIILFPLKKFNKLIKKD